eukprot:scaffold114276_cov31-Tisochrysis_lutea.AAC.3
MGGNACNTRAHAGGVETAGAGAWHEASGLRQVADSRGLMRVTDVPPPLEGSWSLAGSARGASPI